MGLGVRVDGLAVAAEAIGYPLTVVEELRDRDRSRVVRAAVDGGPETVIVKLYPPDFVNRWHREASALTVLSGRGLPIGELVTAVDDPALVVLRDAGQGPSLAGALLAADAEAATTRLHAWVDALTSIHAAGTGDRPAFAAGLRAGDDPDLMPVLLAEGAGMLADALPALGLTAGPEALTELRCAAAALSPGGITLSPSDPCPDNNVQAADGVVLFDFEHASTHHVAWDAAYLVVPWPSCWCSWGLPDDVSTVALRRFRTRLAPHLPMVGTRAFDRDLDVAVVAWAFLSTGWFLPAAIDEAAPSPGGTLRGPSRRAVIQHRMRLVTSRWDVFPALGELADQVLATTIEGWGELRLEVAPAYR